MLLNKSGINAKTAHATPGDGRSISTLNGENAFVSFRYRRLGEMIELKTELSVFVFGRWLPEELGREVTTDEDDALSIAVDLEYAAVAALKIRDEDATFTDPVDFQTALEREFAREARQYAAAAE